MNTENHGLDFQPIQMEIIMSMQLNFYVFWQQKMKLIKWAQLREFLL